jgi:hypothetical protein
MQDIVIHSASMEDRVDRSNTHHRCVAANAVDAWPSRSDHFSFAAALTTSYIVVAYAEEVLSHFTIQGMQQLRPTSVHTACTGGMPRC